MAFSVSGCSGSISPFGPGFDSPLLGVEWQRVKSWYLHAWLICFRPDSRGEGRIFGSDARLGAIDLYLGQPLVSLLKVTHVKRSL
jgi:hypothetical protein